MFDRPFFYRFVEIALRTDHIPEPGEVSRYRLDRYIDLVCLVFQEQLDIGIDGIDIIDSNIECTEPVFSM